MWDLEASAVSHLPSSGLNWVSFGCYQAGQVVVIPEARPGVPGLWLWNHGVGPESWALCEGQGCCQGLQPGLRF